MFTYQTMDKLPKKLYSGMLIPQEDEPPMPKTPKFRSEIITIDGRDITISIDLEHELKYEITDDLGLGFEAFHFFYTEDVVEACCNLAKGKDHVFNSTLRRYEDEPEVDPSEVARRLDGSSEWEKRLGVFLAACCRCSDDDVIKYIVQRFPKNENGWLKKWVTMPIAMLYYVNRYSNATQLVVKSCNEQELEIVLSSVKVTNKTMEEVNKDISVETDFFRKLPLEGDYAMRTNSNKAPKSDEEDW